MLVTLTDGSVEVLRRCLASLDAQVEVEPFEVLVPFDAPVAGVQALAREFPATRFLRVDGLETGRARRGVLREHHDRLRSAGLVQVRGAIVAFLEDQSVADPRWLSSLVSALRSRPDAGAVGGAVECAAEDATRLAIWHCDFVRYARPFQVRTAPTVSDTNVAYPMAALSTVADTWTVAYREPEVHAALRARGFGIWLVPEAVNSQARAAIGPGRAMRERVAWGRSFGGARARRFSGPQRIAGGLLCALLPVVLTARVVGHGLRRRRTGELLRALPMIILLEIAWSVGEAIGTFTGRAEPGER